jgi:hypothetical protein
MKRRFGRGRRSRTAGDGKRAPINAQRALERIVEAGIVAVEALAPASSDEIPDTYAVVGTGATGKTEESEPSARVAVGFSPVDGGDAALATLATAQRMAADEGFAGDAIAVAPQWSIAARRRLALVGDVPFRFRAVAASALADGDNTVEPEPGVEPPVGSPERVVADLASPDARELFRRAVAAFEGLAAKHGGAVRGFGGNVELVLLARRVAVLRADAAGLCLETLLPDRLIASITSTTLATAMDRLEGSLRKRLNDRRVRGSEEGLRARLAPALASAAGLRAELLWPLGGSDPEVVDLVGIDDQGRVAVGAVRAQLTLPALGSILDAALALRPALPGILGAQGLSPSGGPLRLLLAAQEVDTAVLQVLPALKVEGVVYDLESRRGREPELVRRTSAVAVSSRPVAPAPAAPPTRSAEVEELEAGAEGAEPTKPAGRRFDEVSLFDLDDESRSAGEVAGSEPGRRRRRGRRRGRRGSSGEAPARDRSAVPAARDRGEAGPEEPERGAREGRGTGRARKRRSARAEGEDQEAVEGGEPGVGEPVERELPADAEADADVDVDVDDLAETLAPIDADVPEIAEALELGLEEEAGEEDELEDDRLHRERELRRRARLAKAEPEPPPAAPARPPRRRTAFVTHADRESVVAAILLARDLRLIEGFWVYPQRELMTFFRSVATDLRSDTPIQLIGFRPAHDVLQAASLYGDRISWFDHHDWPPEDLAQLSQAIGNENLHVESGAGSSLSAVLSVRTRRSRFSDKLVELVTGRFSEHDYDRWGRVWWHRLAEIAARSGERRGDVDALLNGRPSDLAREASTAPPPPEPEEVRFVSQRDFRLVHFGGYTLVVLPTPRGLDLHLAARIARERYAAELSLSLIVGDDGRIADELVVLGGEAGQARRSFDLGRMAGHLVSKHYWIEALPNADHVARVRVRDLPGREERLDDVIREIAMGRSILEG